MSLQKDTYTKQNSFAVLWEKELPKPGPCPAGCQKVEGATSCICNLMVELLPVFSAMPASESALRRSLRIGAYQPYSAPFAVNDTIKVKAYSSAGVYDVDTVFECCNGKFFKNAKSRVAVGGMYFRNAPVCKYLHLESTARMTATSVSMQSSPGARRRYRRERAMIVAVSAGCPQSCKTSC